MVTGDPASLERKLLAGGRAYVPGALGKWGSQSGFSHAPPLRSFLPRALPLLGWPGLSLVDTCHRGHRGNPSGLTAGSHE